MNCNGFSVKLKKTEIVDVNDESHPLPPDSGTFKEFKVADYECPSDWSKDGVFVEVKEGEPLWIDFRGNDECACLPSVQRLNPVTGEASNLELGLSKDPKQNYLAVPRQPWLDGYAKDGKVYQFIVTKSGIGLAVNEYVLPKHMQDSHALAFAFFGPKNPKPKVIERTVYKHSFLPPTKSWQPHEQWMIGSSSGGGKVSSNGPVGSMGGCASADSVDWDSYIKSASVLRGMPLNAQNISGSIPMSNTSEQFAKSIDETSVSCFNAQTDECIAAFGETVDILEDKTASLEDCDKASMGAGGRIVQSIVQDNNTTEYYHEKPSGVLIIYLALPDMFKKIMNKGLRQNASKKDKYIHSGQISGIQVPLISAKK